MAAKSSDLHKGFRNKRTCNHMLERNDIIGMSDKWQNCVVQTPLFF